MSNVDRSMPLRLRVRAYQKRSDQPENVYVGGRDLLLTRTRNGTTNPHWKQQILNLENATTALSGVKDTVNITPAQGVWKFLHPSTGLTKDITYSGDAPLLNGIWDPGIIPPTLSSQAAINNANAKFYAMLRSEVQAVSGPTFLGELRETLAMLKRPMSALHSQAHGYLDTLSKAKRRDPKNWTKAISGAWLEQSFGWAPLIQDVKGAMQGYSRLNKPRKGRMFSTGFSDVQSQPTALQSPFNAAGNVSYFLQNIPVAVWYKGRVVDRVTLRYKGRIKAQSDLQPFDNWKLFGFQPNEFLPTAWELLPWSFLADYFTNIGDVLNAAATTTDHVEVAWTNSTLRRVSVAQLYMVEDIAGTGSANNGWTRVLGTLSGGSSYSTRSTINRGTLSGFPPLPTFMMNCDLGQGQLANIAALLGQAQALHPQRVRGNWHR